MAPGLPKMTRQTFKHSIHKITTHRLRSTEKYRTSNYYSGRSSESPVNDSLSSRTPFCQVNYFEGSNSSLQTSRVFPTERKGREPIHPWPRMPSSTAFKRGRVGCFKLPQVVIWGPGTKTRKCRDFLTTLPTTHNSHLALTPPSTFFPSVRLPQPKLYIFNPIYTNATASTTPSRP